MNSKNIFLNPTLVILALAFSLSSLGQSNIVEFRYPIANLHGVEQIDSIYNLALSVSKSDGNYKKALLFRNEYGWDLNKVEQLKLDIPEILKQEEFSKIMSYLKIFKPFRSDPSKWELYLEICTELLSVFEKGTFEYTEVLGIKSLVILLANKNEMALKVLPELLDELPKNTDSYFSVLFHYGTVQSIGDENAAIITFEYGYKKSVNSTKQSNFAMSLMNLYSIHKKYDNIIEEKAYITAQRSGILLYFLGEAYFRKGNYDLALRCFNRYMSHFKEREEAPNLVIESEILDHPVRPEHLFVLAEFYSGIDSEKSCKCYNYIQKIMSRPKDDQFYLNKLATMEEGVAKDISIKKHGEYMSHLDDILKKSIKNLKSCK